MDETKAQAAASGAGPVRLNMGCGYDRRPGWINVDKFAGFEPDVVCDLEALPWPWADNSVDAVEFRHSLEHLGGDPAVFLGMMKELYRVCRDEALIEIWVPHPRHDNFINDPTHVRAITVPLLTLFDKKACEEWTRERASNTKLAIQLDVDFYIENAVYVPDPVYAEQLRSGKISGSDLEVLVRERNNVAEEIRINLRVRKPQGK